MRIRKSWIIGGVAVALLVVVVWGVRTLREPPAFDPDAMARSEAIMWRAYYDGNRVRLALETVAMLRRNYGLSARDAVIVANKLAAAAVAFRETREDYERLVLPDLVDAYTHIKHAIHAPFDPEAAARAELAWWKARRIPEQRSAEEVGSRITALYEIQYSYSHPAFAEAGLYRARAARLRDQGGRDADWVEVERLLRESYHHLARGLAKR